MLVGIVGGIRVAFRMFGVPERLFVGDGWVLVWGVPRAEGGSSGERVGLGREVGEARRGAST